MNDRLSHGVANAVKNGRRARLGLSADAVLVAGREGGNRRGARLAARPAPGRDSRSSRVLGRPIVSGVRKAFEKNDLRWSGDLTATAARSRGGVGAPPPLHIGRAHIWISHSGGVRRAPAPLCVAPRGSNLSGRVLCPALDGEARFQSRLAPTTPATVRWLSRGSLRGSTWRLALGAGLDRMSSPTRADTANCVPVDLSRDAVAPRPLVNRSARMSRRRSS